MDTTQTRKHTFLAPRQFRIVIYQFFGSVFLSVSLVNLIPSLIACSNWSHKDFLVATLFILSPLLLGLAIIFLTQKHIVRVVVDKEHSRLIIKKKGHPDEEHDLQTIDRFVLTEVIAMPGVQRTEVCAETDDGASKTLFSNDIVSFTRSWSRFGEKLATLTDKPLRKDYLVEDLDGKLVKNKLK